MRRDEEEQPQVCDQCGGDAFRPASRREQLARWLTHGGGASSAWYCGSCSASWSGGSGYGMAYRTAGSGWRRRVRLPLEVLEALRGARRWHPVPIFYAAVGGLALVPAVALAALPRSRWWVPLVGVPVAAVAGTFLWSLATAVGRGGRRDVLWRLAPERAWRRELEEEFVGIREQIGGFPLLVPAGWPGELSLDGASWSMPPGGGRVLQEMMVVADQGDPQLDPGRHTPGWRPPTPRVEIRSTCDAWNDLEGHALSEFVDRAFRAATPNLESAGQAGQQETERRMRAADREDDQARRRWESELAERWCDGSMQVDGAAIRTRVLTHDDADVGIATLVHDGRGILVIAEGIDPDTIALVSVADRTPLADEFELRRRRTFSQSG